jgi:hypothetical protein
LRVRAEVLGRFFFGIVLCVATGTTIGPLVPNG